ncbi:MAG TPA: hypothetical protein VGW35_05145 [Methylomirabilota bacterium]|jgi:hypothetical protein|nr:hypothetical protein [Methylomirabilota bacterium]
MALLALLLAVPWPALADEKLPAANIALEGLYQRLSPGMTSQDVARTAGRETMLKPGKQPRTWLLWTPPFAGRPIEVLRTAFRDGRLARIEYESFGDEYRHLVKGDRRMETDSDQVTRLWRRSAEVMEAAEDCGEALEAFHHLVVGLQERLTSPEQQAWVRALQLRRAAQAGLGSLSR